jgi:choline dehydrogenase-like flavoprotein
MLIDIDELPAGTAIEADVCIIGAGPAGLTLGHELGRDGLRVAIFEAGGTPRRRSRLGELRVPLSEGSDFSAPPLTPPSFGGAANEWVVRLPWMRAGVRVLPLSPIDLETRSWVPHSGWPIEWDQLKRYYLRANAFLELPGWGYDPDEWADDRWPTISFGEDEFATAIERFTRADLFTRDLRDYAKRSSSVTVYLNAQVGHLRRDDDRVERLEIDSDHDRPITATGNVVVLACGGLRNPQILFNANEGRGLGGNHDVLGRYYMDHLRIASGTITPSSRNWVEGLRLYDLVCKERSFRSATIVPTAGLLESKGLLNSAVRILPAMNPRIRALLRRNSDGDEFSSPMSTAETIKVAAIAARAATELSFRQRRFPPRVDAGWSELSTANEIWSSLSAEHQIEQAPDPGNRVIPSDRVDRFGRREVQLEWGWTDVDLASLATSIDLFGRAVASARLGDFEPRPWNDGPPVTTPAGAFHPMGGTRMSASPRTGVVDADLRVHGTTNLFVVGSSVFPTGGYANPVLTVIALAIRLGDLLRRELTTPVSTR